jgi:hypothetical protein
MSVPDLAAGFTVWARWICLALPAAIIAKLATEARIHRHIDDQESTPLRKTALLLRGELRMAHAWRFNAALLGGLLLPMFWLYHARTAVGAIGVGDLILAFAILAAVLAGEWLERYLFFTACVPPRMPGS